MSTTNTNEPTEKIEDKEMYHRLDALRYIASEVISRRNTPIGSRAAGGSAQSDPFAGYGKFDPFKDYNGSKS